VKFLDACAMIGPHFSPREGRFYSSGDLIETMDTFGIDEALVYHGMALEYDPGVGHARLTAELAGQSRLHPCWIGEVRAGEAFAAQAIDGGAKAVRYHFGGLLDDLRMVDVQACDALLTGMAKARLPLFVEIEGGLGRSAGDMAAFDSLLEQYATLPVIYSAVRVWDEKEILLSRLARYPNLHIEISGFNANGVLEHIAGMGYANRLIFATRFPWFGSGQVKIALMYADISEANREAIAGRNLERLMAGAAL